ncbi:MAG: AgmX/PglI C-terminal domain-containing protein [Candidatus Binatia bacterium]
MSSRNRERPVGFKGLVGFASCVIGLGVVYFGYGIGTESPKKDAAVEPGPAAQADRKRPVRAMNMALGNMVFFARDLGFGVKGAKDGDVDLSKIAARIEGQLQEIRELYRQEVIKNSALAGGLTLQLSIGPTGEVSQVRELSSRLNDGDFKQAVIAAASKWSFGEAVGEDLQVNCPLLFVHEGMDITTLVQWEKSLGQGAENAALARPVGNPAPVQPAALARGVTRANPRPATAAKSDAREFQIKYATALRKDPDFSSPSLATLTIGTKVIVLRRHGDWLEVRPTANGRTGFIRKEFVTPLEVAHQ